MIYLPNVTLIAVATRDVEATVRAMEYSCKDISFGAVKLVSPYIPEGTPIPHEYIAPFVSIDQWNQYIVYNLWKHFDTSHCFLVHADGAICHADKWQDKWLSYDYCGSPWDEYTALAIQGGRDQPLSRVGNSVGLRSRKLCKLPSDINLPWRRFNNDSNEDSFICGHQRRVFEEHGCTYMPFEEAIYFGRETPLPENEHIEPFCYHKWLGNNIKYPRF